jgi:hypothetical protein
LPRDVAFFEDGYAIGRIDVFAGQRAIVETLERLREDASARLIWAGQYLTIVRRLAREYFTQFVMAAMAELYIID